MTVNSSLKNKIENFISSLPAKEAFSGNVLVARKGDVLFEESFGFANFELDVKNTPEKIFRIGSVTKQFTAAAILSLVEKSKLSLDDTVSKFIQDYPRGDDITVHHLLCHTSGIFNYTNQESFTSFMRNHYTLDEAIDMFKNLPLDFEPGEKYSYSNSGYTLLGLIIEKSSGMSYNDFLCENIFKNFSLESTSYENSNAILKNRSCGYEMDNETGELVNSSFIDMSLPHAAGSLISTTGDLHKWNNLLHEGNIVSKESLNLMCKKHIHIEDSLYYGYGLMFDELEINNKKVSKVFHGGGIPGFLCMNSTFPQEEIQIIVLSNIASEYFSKFIENIEPIILETLV